MSYIVQTDGLTKTIQDKDWCRISISMSKGRNLRFSWAQRRRKNHCDEVNHQPLETI